MWTWPRATSPVTGRRFVAHMLPRVARSFAGRPDTPPCLVRAEGSPDTFQIGPEQPDAPLVSVRGPAAELLAWLLGRDGGSGLQVSGGPAAPPVLPAWR